MRFFRLYSISNNFPQWQHFLRLQLKSHIWLWLASCPLLSADKGLSRLMSCSARPRHQPLPFLTLLSLLILPTFSCLATHTQTLSGSYSYFIRLILSTLFFHHIPHSYSYLRYWLARPKHQPPTYLANQPTFLPPTYRHVSMKIMIIIFPWK